MKKKLLAVAAIAWSALACSAAVAEFEEGVRLKADGKDINTTVGHLVPCVADWNNDGKKDLLVGQFSGGIIQVYLNRGTDVAPVFKNSNSLRAGGAEIRLPAG